MGVYIGGMRKPDNCFECKMFTYDDDCIFQNEITDSYEEQYRNCPLVEVKTPHGDLFESESVYETIDAIRSDIKCGDWQEGVELLDEVVGEVWKVPTIIPAEGE